MRTLELERPLVFFDLETTGVNVQTDRIVQMAVVRLLPEMVMSEDVWLVNPGIPIPETSTAVHGITNEDVADMPTFSDISEEVAKWFVGADVCGHNIIRFDIPLLKNEMKRAGRVFEIDGGAVDTLRIFQARFRHNLQCAHRLYVGHEFEGAHSALEDVDAVIAVLKGMLLEYPDLPVEPGELSRTPPSPDWIDAEGKFVWVGEEATFSFGSKTNGRTLKEVAKNDHGFLEWMLGQDFDVTTLRVVRRALNGDFPVKAASQ